MQALRAGRADDALAQLREVARPSDAVARQMQYARAARELAPHLPRLPVLRMAFLAGSTIDPLIDVFGFWILLAGFRLQAWNAPFDTWRQQAMDANSALHEFRPDAVWLFLCARDLRLDNATTIALPDETPELTALNEVIGVVKDLCDRCRVPVFVNNAELPARRVLGNFEGQSAQSLSGRLRRYNEALAQALPSGATLFDLAHEAACFGLTRWEDARLWFHSRHPFALDATGPVAFAGAGVLAAARGRSRKCVVLDLDNTLWGGVVGDDGPQGIRLGSSGGAAGEAFVAFQSWLKALSNRGVALAVSSKNDEALAREPFRTRPEMVLGLDDFAVFCANWSNKADNLRAIARAMNIGVDSLVFVDDNPAERALIRAELPEVAVVDLPEDPCDFIAALAAGHWFETLQLTDEDRVRAEAYRSDLERQEALSTATDIDTYLKSLEMHATWGEADDSRLARMAQLLNKTNQFQPTEQRYSENELAAMAADNTHWLLAWFSLRDRFGEHGVISMVALRLDQAVASIEAWPMSCRVFARGMEDFILRVMRREAASRGCRTLVARYVPTAKNGVVAKMYERLGGMRAEEAGTHAGQGPNQGTTTWQFDLVSPPPAVPVYIEEHCHPASPPEILSHIRDPLALERNAASNVHNE